MRIMGLLLLASLLLVAGCAQTRTQGNVSIAEETTELIQEVTTCATEAGATEEGARAKDPAERTTAEHALLAALDAERDVASALRQTEGAQARLDRLLERQREADARVNHLSAARDSLRGIMSHWVGHYRDLFTLANYLAVETGDAEESVDWSLGGEPQAERVMILVGGTLGFIVAGPVSVLGGIGAVIGDILGTENKRDRLREFEARIVRDMMGNMQEMVQTLEESGYGGDLLGPIRHAIGGAQMFLGEYDNPDREIRPRPMLEAMMAAWDAIVGADARISEDLEDATGDLARVTEETQEAFQAQREAEEELVEARDRMAAALTTCQTDPFITLLTTPGSNQTWWVISSP